MPLPLIPILIGVASLGAAGTGLYKGAKAISDNSDANDINNKANSIIKEAKASLEAARKRSRNALVALGNNKIAVCQSSIEKFVVLFEQIKNLDLQDSIGLQELSKFHIDQQAISDFKEISMLAESFASGALSGAVAGGAVAFGAYSAAGALATASTGTAISTLSGAAATNATLAFFGGGALTAGGLGVAGGTAILGGLVAGPALAIVGIVMGAKASANLDNAYSNLTQARTAREEIGVLVTACTAIARRAKLFNKILVKLDRIFCPLLDQLENVILTEGINYKKYSPQAQQVVAATVSTAQAVKALLDTPLLDEKGQLTRESGKLAHLLCEKCQIPER